MQVHIPTPVHVHVLEIGIFSLLLWNGWCFDKYVIIQNRRLLLEGGVQVAGSYYKIFQYLAMCLYMYMMYFRFVGHRLFSSSLFPRKLRNRVFVLASLAPVRIIQS